MEFGTCPQLCINKKGTHECKCEAGYRKGLTGCKHTGSSPYILIGAENQIYKSDLGGHHLYSRAYPRPGVSTVRYNVEYLCKIVFPCYFLD